MPTGPQLFLTVFLSFELVMVFIDTCRELREITLESQFCTNTLSHCYKFSFCHLHSYDCCPHSRMAAALLVGHPGQDHCLGPCDNC